MRRLVCMFTSLILILIFPFNSAAETVGDIKSMKNSVDQKINDLEGIGVLIKTQTDLELIQRKILNNPLDFKRRSTPN